MSVTREQAKAALLAIKAVADVIREVGEVPSGVLYARLMEHLSYQQYQSIIDQLKRCELVSEKNNLLTWKGPKP